MIFGAGDDAIPLAELANHLGWRVSVFDGRAHYARPGKFPSADEVIVRQAGAPAPKIDEWTVAVVMTHSYSQDLDVLRMLCSQPLRYLGVLGPRKRSMQLLGELSTLERESLTGLHTPMGLDLGGDGPEPVALAVIAEIQSVLQGRAGGALSNRSGPIHSGEAKLDEKDWARSIVCA
jgi:xanthine/CO dehydrogenase XdhC/CoxF family maturation factor